MSFCLLPVLAALTAVAVGCSNGPAPAGPPVTGHALHTASPTAVGSGKPLSAPPSTLSHTAPLPEPRNVFAAGDAGTLAPEVADDRPLVKIAQWWLPGGGSPDMGNLTADGAQLWVSGRYNNVVYVVSTTDGTLLHTINVGNEPHGLTVWPQPGSYSLGHTGITR